MTDCTERHFPAPGYGLGGEGHEGMKRKAQS